MILNFTIIMLFPRYGLLNIKGFLGDVTSGLSLTQSNYQIKLTDSDGQEITKEKRYCLLVYY